MDYLLSINSARAESPAVVVWSQPGSFSVLNKQLFQARSLSEQSADILDGVSVFMDCSSPAVI